MLGGIMAASGMGYYTYQGVKKNYEQAKVVSEGTWNGKFQDPAISISDVRQRRWDNGQTLVRVDKGMRGLPRAYYEQAGSKAWVRTYGLPETNITTHL